MATRPTSTIRKFLDWLVTENGRQFSYYVAGTAIVTTFVGHVLPHTLLLDQVENIFRLYKDGFTMPVPEKLVATFEKALELSEIDPQDRHLFKPFMSSGLEILSVGSAYSRFGVRVGLPVTFTYDSVDDIERHKFTVRGDSIQWDTPEAKSLLDACVLSEKAKLYAIAREVKFRETPKIFIDSLESLLVASGIYGLANYVNVRRDLYGRPLQVRLILYFIVGLLGLGNYFMVKDMSQMYFEKAIDEEMSRNAILKAGGQEYYDKMLARNRALRALLGDQGERSYSSTGNEIYLFRQKHVPLMDRKLLFE